MEKPLPVGLLHMTSGTSFCSLAFLSLHGATISGQSHFLHGSWLQEAGGRSCQAGEGLHAALTQGHSAQSLVKAVMGQPEPTR